MPPQGSETMFRNLTLILLSSLVLAGCSASSRLQSTFGSKYRYSFSMVEPERSNEMLFRDEQLIIQFRLDDPGIRFQVQNISAVDMKIDWARAAIKIDDRQSSVRNLATFHDTTKTVPASQIVPSLGVVRDVVVPRANIYSDGTQWRVDDLLPTTDAGSFAMRTTIANMVGRSIELLLPIGSGQDDREYRFRFSVDSVHQIPWSDYHAPGWIPPHPPIHKLKPSFNDNVVAVVIAGGFLGILHYMTSLKKTPVVE